MKHGFVAFMTLAVLAALHPPPTRFIPDSRKANAWQGFHKASVNKRGKKRGKKKR